MDDKKNRIFACLVMAVLMLTIGIYAYEGSRESVIVTQTGDSIKWVDFNIGNLWHDLCFHRRRAGN